MSVIFYFSGTGNCLDVAKQAAAALQDCRLESISGYMAKHFFAKLFLCEQKSVAVQHAMLVGFLALPH